MIDALGVPQCLLVLGGASDIGLAIARRYATVRPLTVVLAGRTTDTLESAAEELRATGCTVTTTFFDAGQYSSHERVIDEIFSQNDVDIAVVAFGQQPEQHELSVSPEKSAELAVVNYAGAVSAGVSLANAMRRQGHGVIVVLSSVAGERPRKSNYTYGSTKAGLDAFYQGLGDELSGSGVSVVVVRPGFVRTKLTASMEPAPLATTADIVADAVADGVRRGSHTVWVPSTMRWVMSVLRHTPRSVFRRLPV